METKRITAAVVTLLVASSIRVPLLCADAGWPEFHGPGRTNISPDRGLLKEWPDGGPRLLWTYSQCGRGYSGVAIAQGMIFTAGDFDREEMVLALDMDGKLLWKQPNGAAWRRSSPGSRATPTYNDGALYHMNPTGRLAADEATSGKPLWAVDLKPRFDAKMQKELAKIKTVPNRVKKANLVYQSENYLIDNVYKFKAMLALYKEIQTVKQMVIDKLDHLETFRTFVETEKGYKVTTPEGYVLHKDGSMIKFVNRLEFA